MRGAIKTILGITLLILPMLIHVHGRLALFRISYDLNDQTELLSRKQETYRMLKFEVDQLKAPALLEVRMKNYAMDLVLPKEVRVIQIPAMPLMEVNVVGRPPMNPLLGNISDFFGRWIGVAQADIKSS